MAVSVSDQSNGAPIKAKRLQRPLTEDQWKLARIQFETTAGDVTQQRIAAIFNTSLSSVQKRSAAEKWSKGAQIVGDARKHLQVATDNALAAAAQKAGTDVARRLMDELQPWVEKEKRVHIQRAIKRSKRAMKRLDRVAKGYQVYDSKLGALVDCQTDPKDEMHLANAEDKYDGIIRRNLGLNDGDSGIGSALSVRVLNGDVAVEVTQGS